METGGGEPNATYRQRDLFSLFGRSRSNLDTPSPPEPASVLAVSRIIIYKLAKKNRIPSFRVGSCVRFDPKAVANWLRRQ
jgi:excisionase family DNA binding protein